MSIFHPFQKELPQGHPLLSDEAKSASSESVVIKAETAANQQAQRNIDTTEAPAVVAETTAAPTEQAGNVGTVATTNEVSVLGVVSPVGNELPTPVDTTLGTSALVQTEAPQAVEPTVPKP